MEISDENLSASDAFSHQVRTFHVHYCTVHTIERKMKSFSLFFNTSTYVEHANEIIFNSRISA